MPDRATDRVLVTGAAGFLGRHLVEALERDGASVVGVDRCSHDAITSGRSTHMVRDLDTGDLAGLLHDLQPSVIFHLAGGASVPGSIEDPDGDFRSAVYVTQRLAEAVRSSGLHCRLIYFSSAAVYGNPPSLPVREDAPVSPLSPYGYHKVIGETIVREYARLHGVPGCSLRIFSAFGTGLRRQLLWDVLRKAQVEGCVTLKGTGNETRDFVHASDVARAALCVWRCADFDGETYNVASGTERSVREVAAAVMRASGIAGDAMFSGDVRPGDPTRWCADISRLRTFGWAPSREFGEAVADYVRWAEQLC